MPIKFYSEDCGFLPRGRMKIASWIALVAKKEKMRVGDLSYIFCSGDYHLNINRQYLGHDYRTDVITFDYCEPGKKRICGDIFIDQQTVAAQAEEWGSTPDEELMRIMVHGMLHLCGYDDKDERDRKVMRQKEDTYLALYRSEYGDYPVQNFNYLK